MKPTINTRIEAIYKEVGEFGPYQLLVIIFVGLVSSISVFVGFSYTFYGAVPNHRYIYCINVKNAKNPK